MIVTLLIFTSPAELGLATPLVIIAAIARAARSGILIKGGIFLETLAKVDVIVFDKTGTLTANRPEVAEVETRDDSFTASELLRLSGCRRPTVRAPAGQGGRRRRRTKGH